MAPLTPIRRNLFAAAIIACGLALSAPRTDAQLFEFTGSELRGRIDRPGLENIWTFGDANGNGTLDDDEQFGTRIGVDDTFLESPGNAFVRPQRSGLATNDRPVGMGSQTQIITAPNDLNEPVIVGFAVDYPDLYHFSPYNSLTANVYAEFSSAQLMQILRFEGEPEFTLTRAHETLELGCGARFLTNPQYAQFSISGIVGASTVDNQAVGPQLLARWSVRQGRWQARAEAAAALTYLDIDGDQVVDFGPQLIPGGLNRPAVLMPTQTSNQLTEWDVAPTLEAGVLASYDLTPSSLIFIRGDAIQFGNIRGVEQAVVWQLPTMGLRDPGGRDITITAASIGLEIRR